MWYWATARTPSRSPGDARPTSQSAPAYQIECSDGTADLLVGTLLTLGNVTDGFRLLTARIAAEPSCCLTRRPRPTRAPRTRESPSRRAGWPAHPRLTMM